MNMNSLKGNIQIFVNGTLHCTFCWFLMAANGIVHHLPIWSGSTLTHATLFMLPYAYKYLKMTVCISVFWKIYMYMPKKWLERIVKW